MIFCARIVNLSATQRSKKNSSHGEKTCEGTWPAEEKASCSLYMGYRVHVEGAVVAAGDRK